MEQLSLPDASSAPELQPLPPYQLPPLEPSMMAHGIEYPVLFGQVGSVNPAVPLPGFQ